MSTYRLCRIKRTEYPFYIRTIGINAYSLEEICYYIVHFPVLLDESFICQELASWVSEKLDQPSLGRTLEKALGKNEDDRKIDPSAFIEAILKADGYLDAAGSRAFAAAWRRLSGLTPAKRLKQKADALVGCGRPSSAVAVYKELLEDASFEMSDEMTASIWHNKGVAAMQLLEYRQALADFEKALSICHTLENMKAYLLAFALARPRDRYEDELVRLGVDEKTAADIEAELRMANESVVYPPVPDTDAYLYSLTSDYHRRSGV